MDSDTPATVDDEAALVESCLNAVTAAMASLSTYTASSVPSLLSVMGSVRKVHSAAQALIDHDAKEFRAALASLAESHVKNTP